MDQKGQGVVKAKNVRKWLNHNNSKVFELICVIFSETLDNIMSNLHKNFQVKKLTDKQEIEFLR